VNTSILVEMAEETECMQVESKAKEARDMQHFYLHRATTFSML
jgi:hypothetical protein